MYITYLLTRKMTPYEVRADCVSRGLMPPNDEAVSDILEDIGVFPGYWRSRMAKTNVPFRRWLRNLGVLSLWAKDTHAMGALKFLGRTAVRKDFEAILLVHGDVEQAHTELHLKYPKALVPPKASLQQFYNYFWDVGSMTPEGIFEHVEASQGKEDYLPALQGDVAQAYGILGLQQQVSYEHLLQSMVDLSHQATSAMRKDLVAMGGAKIAALVTVALAGAKAGQELRDIRGGDTNHSSTRREAAEFMSRRIPQVRTIPSIDEITRDVIDAEYTDAEGEDNVHRLSANRD